MTRKIKHEGYVLYECAPEVPDELCYKDDDDISITWVFGIVGTIVFFALMGGVAWLLKLWIGL